MKTRDILQFQTPVFCLSFFNTNLMHKFFIIHLLYSSTCFEHYYAHLQEDSCVSTASGIVTLFGWLFISQVTRGLSCTNSLLYIYYIPLHVSSTVMLIFRRTFVLVQHLVSSLSLGDCSIHRLQEDSRPLVTCVLSDDTRCCTDTIVLLKMSIIVLETCRGM